MKSVVIAMNAFSVLICLILLLGCRFESRQFRRDKMKAYHIFIHINLILALIEIFSMAFHERSLFAKAMYSATSATNIGVFMLIIVFVKHLYLQISEKKPVSSRPFKIITALSVVMVLGTSVASHFGYITHIVDDNIVEAEGFAMYNLATHALLATLIVMIVIYYKVLGLHDTIAALAFLFFPLVSIALGMVVTGYSNAMVYPAMTLSLLLNYIMLREENVNIQAAREQLQHEYAEELKAAKESAEAANRAKTDFLFSMSHDIRTPMNAIMGFTNLLEKNLDDRETTLNYISKIKNSNEFLLSLINNVLEMARIDSGKEILNESVCNAHEFTESLMSVFETQMREKGINFTVTTNIQHPEIITDAVKMREILLNILSNALKYTQTGGSVKMTINELPSERAGFVKYQTIVEDTGIGMTPQFLPHIFEEFTRANTSTVSKVSGTGLGMPIVKKLVELMNGTITVESELGKGSRFTVTIPHRLAEPEELNHFEELPLDYKIEDFEGKRILMAEDNDLNAEIATAILEEVGLKIERAADGIICVDMLENSAPDYYSAILMDIQMPNMNGYKATRIIRRLTDEQKANIPIIAMTANAFEEDRRDALRAGMNAHIAKPIKIENFKKVLAQALAHMDIGMNTLKMWCQLTAGSEPFLGFIEECFEKGIPCGWLVYEALGKEQIIYADKTTINMFGCEDFDDFQSHVGKSFRTLVHPDDIVRVESEIQYQQYDSEINIDHIKYRIIRKDGSVRTLDDIGRKVYIGNGSSIYMVCLADITE